MRHRGTFQISAHKLGNIQFIVTYKITMTTEQDATVSITCKNTNLHACIQWVQAKATELRFDAHLTKIEFDNLLKKGENQLIALGII